MLQELEAIEFIGLSKLLGVKLLDEKEPRDFYVLLHDCLERFEQLSRKKRKEILKILKEAKKERKLNSMHQFIWCFFVAIKLNLKAIFHIY